MKRGTIIIVKSIYGGNTMKIAKAMGNQIGCKVVTVEDAKRMDLVGYEIVGLGSGIYFTSHHPELMEILGRLESSQKVFLFSTHGGPFLGSYHQNLKEKVRNAGISIVGEFSCKGFDCTGPFILIKGANKGRPNERDEKRAANFVSKINLEAENRSSISGNGFVQLNDCCTGCGKCAQICPMGVFKLKEEKISVALADECIHCSLCKVICPEAAISLHHKWMEAIYIGIRHRNRKMLPRCLKNIDPCSH